MKELKGEVLKLYCAQLKNTVRMELVRISYGGAGKAFQVLSLIYWQWLLGVQF